MFKVLWALIIVALVGFAFLLGVSFGLSNSHGSFITEVVPVLSMLSGWVAGIGSLAAVLTTLWLADKQRREDVENLRVSVNSSIAETGQGGWFISVGVTSDGRRGAKVIALLVTSPHARSTLHISQFHWGSDSLPASLSYGDHISLHLEPGFDQVLKRFVQAHCNGNAKGLKFLVRTTLGEFTSAIRQHHLTLSD